MLLRYGLLLLSIGVACGSEDKITDVDVDEDGLFDLDGDGFYADEDCDDQNININPGTDEVCDGIDNNCNGSVDEGVTQVFYLDSDGDGFGDGNETMEACEIPSGYAPNGNDCDDSASEVFPSAEEICDEIDNDCNDEVDDGVGDIYYQDSDRDGYGDPNAQIQSCTEPPSSSTNNLDCNDQDEEISPDALEYCDEVDNNCDGTIDEEGAIDGELYYQDRDGDSFGDPVLVSTLCEPIEGVVDNNSDCDDNDTAVHPDATEICDEIDNDCDSYTDVEDLDLIDGSMYFEDSDGDNFGNPDVSQLLCFDQVGWVLDDTDCDDTEAGINILAVEICDDGIDNDCNLLADDDDPLVDSSSYSTYYQDSDSDGYGDPSISFLQCEQGAYSTNDQDCDDGDSTLNPETVWYYDGDSDGFGDASNTVQGCSAPVNYVDNDQDCDDGNEHAYPNAAWYIDQDGDGYGLIGAPPVYQCSAILGFAPNDQDCDDFAADVYPGHALVCDDVDHNCDGLVDYDSDGDGYSPMSCGGDDCDDNDASLSPATIWFYDYDSDGYGNPYLQSQSCIAPANYVENGNDCDDQDSDAQPNAAWYADSDADGYGDPNSSPVYQCLPVANSATNDLDCDDGDPSVYTGHAQICDDVDHDCDGVVDYDSDGDGFSDVNCGGTDCDDSDALISEANGAVSNCPALDCDSLLQDFPQMADGVYWFDPDGNGSFQAYCDMDAQNLEGWTLVMRAINVDIAYSDAVWNTTALYDENNYDFAQAGYSKYEAFNRIPFSQLRSAYADDWTDDYIEDFGSNGYSSALALFSGAGLQLTLNSQNENYFLGMITDSYYASWGCTNYRNYGINQQDYLGTGFISAGSYCDWNGGARWGLRYNASHGSTGNHQGIGWGNYTTIGYAPLAINQLMWVR